MPRQRLHISEFTKGLYVNGPKDTTPQGFVRRNRGQHELHQGILRSRNGSTELFALDAHSLFRFDDVRFAGVDSDVYRDGTVVTNVGTQQRLAWVRMPPTSGMVDFLFIAGGGSLPKVDDNGAVTNWGIQPPPDGFGTQRNPAPARTIDLMNDNAATWTPTDCTLADDTTIFVEGTSAIRMTVPVKTRGLMTKAITLDLSTFPNGAMSPPEDYIAFMLRIDNPLNVDGVEVQFSRGNATFASTTYTRNLFGNVDPIGVQPWRAVADVPDTYNNQEQVVSTQTFAPTPSERSSVNDFIGVTTFAQTANTWTRMRLPKSTFSEDIGELPGWESIQAIRFLVRTNSEGPAVVWFDQVIMQGGAGLQGSYKHHVTFRNSRTGTRSNSNPTPGTTPNVLRQTITYNNLPRSDDPQVDQRETWRTVGNGSRFWRELVIDNNTQLVTVSAVADFIGLHTNAPTQVLQSEELPLDNLAPAPSYRDAWGPHLGRMWWTRDQARSGRGRIYFSPPGRAEAVADFIDVTDTDDPMQKGFVWNGTNFAFSEAKLWRIVGTGPFVAVEVFGVPGTMRPFTEVPTPYGIVYQATDGIRIFTGNNSVLVFPEALNAIFRGENLEGLGPFEGLVATYANDEYLVSNGTFVGATTLAVNLRTGVWRDLGVGCNALFFEADTGLKLATVHGKIVVLEAEGANDDAGTPIPIDWEVALGPSAVEPLTLERLYLDFTAASQVVVASVLIDGTETPLGPMNDAGRTVYQFDVGITGRVMSVRLTGAVQRRVELYNVWADVFQPEIT